jgi:hypothetical protein
MRLKRGADMKFYIGSIYSTSKEKTPATPAEMLPFFIISFYGSKK